MASISCSSREEKALAKVGEKKITVKEYEEMVPKVPSKYLSEKRGTDGVKENLQILIDRELLIVEAKNKGIDKEKKFISAWEQIKQEILYNELLKREVKGKANVREAEKKVEEKLMTLFDVKFDPEAISYLTERGKIAQEKIPDIPIEEEGRAVATFKGGKFTVGDYLSLLNDLKPNVRPAADDSAQVMTFIRSVLGRVHLANLAIQDFKIEDDPEVASRLREKRLEMIAEELRRREVDEKATVSEEEMTTYYQSHTERYLAILPAQAHIKALATRTERGARKLLRTTRRGDDFSRLVERYKDKREGDIMGGDFHLHPFETQSYGDLAVQAFQVPVGEIRGPIHVPHYGYTIFQVVEREDPGSFNSAHFGRAKHLVKTELRAEKARRLYDQFILSLRKKHAGETAIFDDRLQLVKTLSDTTVTGSK
jgi:hypothetical protein